MAGETVIGRLAQLEETVALRTWVLAGPLRPPSEWGSRLGGCRPVGSEPCP